MSLVLSPYVAYVQFLSFSPPFYKLSYHYENFNLATFIIGFHVRLYSPNCVTLFLNRLSRRFQCSGSSSHDLVVRWAARLELVTFVSCLPPGVRHLINRFSSPRVYYKYVYYLMDLFNNRGPCLNYPIFLTAISHYRAKLNVLYLHCLVDWHFQQVEACRLYS